MVWVPHGDGILVYQSANCNIGVAIWNEGWALFDFWGLKGPLRDLTCVLLARSKLIKTDQRVTDHPKTTILKNREVDLHPNEIPLRPGTTCIDPKNYPVSG